MTKETKQNAGNAGTTLYLHLSISDEVLADLGGLQVRMMWWSNPEEPWFGLLPNDIEWPQSVAGEMMVTA